MTTDSISKARMDAHEELCAERYRGIYDKLDRVDRMMLWLSRTGFGLVVALMAWMAVQLYSLEPLREAAALAVGHPH